MENNIAPLFSIVIVNHNHGVFIEEAIQSVLSQSCQDYELIIVDGGSTDHSVEIIEKYNHVLAWWVSEQDSGQSSAFNKGFGHATGKFFTWLNADDLLLPNTLKRAKEVLSGAPKIRWLTGNLIRFSENGIITHVKWGPHVYPNFIQKASSPVAVFGPTSFFHREIFFAASGFDERLHYQMDRDLWIRFMRGNIKQSRLNHYCWAFRMHDRSKTAGYTLSRNTDKIRNQMKKERQLISQKNSYKSSRLLKLLFQMSRLADGSVLVAVYNRLQWKGRHINDLISFLKSS